MPQEDGLGLETNKVLDVFFSTYIRVMLCFLHNAIVLLLNRQIETVSFTIGSGSKENV